MTISAKAIAARESGEQPKNPKGGEICPCCKQVIPNARNSQRHKLLFASLPAIFQHWPEGGWQPKDTESLRAWLLVEAGHITTKEHHFPGTSRSQVINGVAAFLMDPEVRKAQRFEEIPNGIRAIIPRSIAYNKCSEKIFRGLVDKIGEIVEITTGVSLDQIRKEHESEI